MAFVDKSSVEPVIFFIEKISFSLKLFSGHFYGQSFIKTVRGPSIIHNHSCKILYLLVCLTGGARHYILKNGSTQENATSYLNGYNPDYTCVLSRH